jgi:hypothetical protein
MQTARIYFGVFFHILQFPVNQNYAFLLISTKQLVLETRNDQVTFVSLVMKHWTKYNNIN